MDLLGGYGSDGSDDDSNEEDAQAPAPKKPRSSPSSSPPAKKDGNGNRKVIDFSKLPVSRPLLLDGGKTEESEAPLRAAAIAENLRADAGRSLLAALPPPKVTLGLEVDMNSSGGGSRLDLSEVKLSRKSVDHRPHTETSIMRGDSAPEISEEPIPEDLLNHPMFRNDAKAGLGGDRPSAQELHDMKNMKFLDMKQADVQDPDWYLNNQISKAEPGIGNKVANEVSMYEKDSWQKSTQSNPTRNHKRKHQINWLAHEAMEKEAEMLDRASSARLTKAQTSMKYGW